jgi:hypothetical protein
MATGRLTIGSVATGYVAGTGTPMFATIRRYAGLTPSSVEALIDRSSDIVAVLASVPGARGSLLVRARGDVVLITLGADESCLVESGRRFRAWVETHLPEFRTAAEADVWVGDVVADRIGADPW